MTRIKIARRVGCALIFALILGGLISCAAVEKPQEAKAKGFLSDYSKMREYDEENLPKKMYINPKANFGKYDKIILAPLSIWTLPGSSLEEIPQKELESIGWHYIEAMKRELSKNYVLIDKPMRGTMWVRFAMTEATGANQAMKTISTVLPIGLAMSAARKLATGTHSFVGSGSFEGEIRDAKTGELLFAYISKRAGGKSLTGAKGTWGDVKAVIDVAAESARTFLLKLHKGYRPRPK
jgi:hypothetical protein